LFFQPCEGGNVRAGRQLGRILAAAGYSGAVFNPESADIYLNGLQVASQGQGLPFSEEDALARLKNQEILVEIMLAERGHEAVAGAAI
jgi:glutamate N-acetyltransferase/amino-acid N-acetyltransferase